MDFKQDSLSLRGLPDSYKKCIDQGAGPMVYRMGKRSKLETSNSRLSNHRGPDESRKTAQCENGAQI